jgi:Holliday junction resolvase RusA-like endonuclease
VTTSGDEALVEHIEAARRGECPPPFNELVFRFPIAPVSQQGRAAKKTQLRQEIQKAFTGLQYYLTGDVTVEIDWFINVIARHEHDSAADVDNIIKPILDSIGGVKGLLIDDTQLLQVVSTWHHWERLDEEIEIKVRWLSDSHFDFKKGLVFVQLKNALYFPLNLDQSPVGLRLLVAAVLWSYRNRELMRRLGVRDLVAHSLLPVSRVFHKGKLTGFRLLTRAEFKKEIRSHAQAD